MTTKEKFILAVTLAAIIITGAVAYSTYQKYNPPADEHFWEQGRSQNELAGWKTYRNEEYGFEIKYQGSIYSSKENEVIITNFPVTEDNHVFKPGEYELTLEFHNESCKGKVDKAQATAIEKGTIYIGSVPPDSYIGNGYAFAMCAESGRNFIYIRVAEEDERGILANQILSTFKFIEPAVSTDVYSWNVYRNTKHGYFFRYPVGIGWLPEMGGTLVHPIEDWPSDYNGIWYIADKKQAFIIKVEPTEMTLLHSATPEAKKIADSIISTLSWSRP